MGKITERDRDYFLLPILPHQFCLNKWGQKNIITSTSYKRVTDFTTFFTHTSQSVSSLVFLSYFTNFAESSRIKPITTDYNCITYKSYHIGRLRENPLISVRKIEWLLNRYVCLFYCYNSAKAIVVIINSESFLKGSAQSRQYKWDKIVPPLLKLLHFIQWMRILHWFFSSLRWYLKLNQRIFSNFYWVACNNLLALN